MFTWLGVGYSGYPFDDLLVRNQRGSDITVIDSSHFLAKFRRGNAWKSIRRFFPLKIKGYVRGFAEKDADLSSDLYIEQLHDAEEYLFKHLHDDIMNLKSLSERDYPEWQRFI